MRMSKHVHVHLEIRTYISVSERALATNHALARAHNHGKVGGRRRVLTGVDTFDVCWPNSFQFSSVTAFNAAMESAEKDKDKKILELQQIIRAQQEEIARLRAAISASEIPASPMAVSEPKVKYFWISFRHMYTIIMNMSNAVRWRVRA